MTSKMNPKTFEQILRDRIKDEQTISKNLEIESNLPYKKLLGCQYMQTNNGFAFKFKVKPSGDDGEYPKLDKTGNFINDVGIPSVAFMMEKYTVAISENLYNADTYMKELSEIIRNTIKSVAKTEYINVKDLSKAYLCDKSNDIAVRTRRGPAKYCYLSEKLYSKMNDESDIFRFEYIIDDAFNDEILIGYTGPNAYDAGVLFAYCELYRPKPDNIVSSQFQLIADNESNRYYTLIKVNGL